MKPDRSARPSLHRSTRGATLRNRILGFLGSVTSLATIVVFNLGCPGDDSPTEPDAIVESVTVTGPTSVIVGGTIQLTATTRGGSGTVITGRLVTWSSSAHTVATVSSDGYVTGVSAGEVAITATSEGRTSDPWLVVVGRAPVSAVTVTGPTSVQVGGTIQLTARTYTLAGEVTDRTVTWSTFLNASVSESGLVTGTSTGLASVVATSEGIQSAPHQVTVTAPPVPPVILTGRVIDFTNQTGIAGATVTFLEGLSSGTVLGSTTTGAGGTFTSLSLFPTSQSTPIVMEATAQNYVGGRVLVASPLRGATTTTEPIPLVPLSASPGGISGTVRNARNGQGIAANVFLYDNRNSNAFASTTANASGAFTFTGLSAGTYRLLAQLTGFNEATRVGVAVGNNGVTAEQDIALSPAGSNDVRIVLTWGSSPSDLDSHLTGPNAGGARFHVWYSGRGNLTAAPFAFLDLDDTSSFGPETITITQFNSSTDVYRYSVHDFTNRSSTSSSALGSSGAKVAVYTSSSVQTFFVPNQPGTLWTVFEMSGGITNPVITPRGQMSFESSTGGGVTSPPADGSVEATTDAAPIGGSVQQHPKAEP